jgi:hypothetical protein
MLRFQALTVQSEEVLNDEPKPNISSGPVFGGQISRHRGG